MLKTKLQKRQMKYLVDILEVYKIGYANINEVKKIDNIIKKLKFMRMGK